MFSSWCWGVFCNYRPASSWLPCITFSHLLHDLHHQAESSHLQALMMMTCKRWAAVSRIICLSTGLGRVHTHVLSLSLSSGLIYIHVAGFVGNPIFCTEHKQLGFWTALHQRRIRGGLTDVLCWCVAVGETNPGLCDPLIRTSETVPQWDSYTLNSVEKQPKSH